MSDVWCLGSELNLVLNVGYCSGLVHGVHGVGPEPVHSSVHLNFSCQVVQITRRSVMATFERAIHVFSRPVDPEIESGAHQVDPDT